MFDYLLASDFLAWTMVHLAPNFVVRVAGVPRSLERQVTPDGVHAERSIAYHRFFLDHYHLVSALLNANGRSLPALGRVRNPKHLPAEVR